MKGTIEVTHGSVLVESFFNFTLGLIKKCTFEVEYINTDK